MNTIIPKEFASPGVIRSVDDSLVLLLRGQMSRREGSVLADLSNKKNNATISGATWTNTPLGHSALSFDGIDDFIYCGEDDSLNLTKAITLETWVKLSELVSNQTIDWNAWLGGYSLNKWFDSRKSNGKMVFFINDIDEERHTSYFNTILQKDIWHHLVGTYDGSEQRVYSNGVSDYVPVIWSKEMKGMTGNLRIESPVEGFDGSIDEIRIYNRALSASEVMERYQNTKHLFGK